MMPHACICSHVPAPEGAGRRSDRVPAGEGEEEHGGTHQRDPDHVILRCGATGVVRPVWCGAVRPVR